MGIKLNAQKGGFSVTDGYLLITSTQMQKYLRPVTITGEDGVSRAGVEDAVQYTARGQVYPSQQEREQNFGATELNFAFSFTHADGIDPVSEAYQHIRANGIAGWALSNLVDV